MGILNWIRGRRDTTETVRTPEQVGNIGEHAPSAPWEVTETVSDGLKREFQINVPVAHLKNLCDHKKIYGRSGMAETIQTIIREVNSKIVQERGIKLATEPRVILPEEEDEVESILRGQSDLLYTLAIEVLPKIELAEYKTITLKRLTADVTDAEIAEALSKITEKVSINESFADAELKKTVRARIAQDYAAMSRRKLKRELLDKLDKMHQFAPPPTLVENEFNSIWQSIEADLKRQGRTFADEGTTEAKARAEYRAIAERRVRLGLVLAEIGERNSIEVSEAELSQAITERARQAPGREQEVWDYFRKNPQAMAASARPSTRRKWSTSCLS